MKLDDVQRLPFPRDVVWSTVRDHMQDLTDYLPNVAAIDVRERHEEEGGVVRLVNYWTAADTEVPAMARSFVDPSKVGWTDRARWDPATWICSWDLEVAMFPERVQCTGQTAYVAIDEDTTEMRVSGDLQIDLKGMLPGLVARRMTPMVEGFVVKLIAPNFEKTAQSVTRYLQDQAT